ncbi:MAG TPA: hypothetical protein VFJ62_02595 [Usitatibacter sp.]|nr:hypothetical protein [Usitatibacter sp.]
MRQEVDDPRWTGAYNHGFGDGTGLEAEFRGVYMSLDWRGKKSLFLSWNVLYDGSLDNGLDRIYLGFNNGGSADTDTLIFKVVAFNSSSVPITAGAPGSVQALNLNAATGLGVPLPSLPAWIAQTKAWLTLTPIGWTIQMYVPYDPAAVGLYSNDGINLPDPFNFFYQIYVLTPTRIGGGAAVGGFVTHKWPLASANVFTGLSGDVYPHPPTSASAWDSFHPSTGPGDPMCPTTGGVSIDSSGIGNMVDGGAPNIVIKYRKATPPPRPVNTLFANVDNQTGAPIGVGQITARFRIADWGSVIRDPAAPWDDVRGGGAVSNLVPIPVGKPAVTAGNPPPLNFKWTLNDTEMDPYIAGKPSDQCILVELSGAGITFFSDSARQNHLIQPASEIAKTAQISVEGLAPIPGGGPKRDVYVAVETRNMPAPSEDGKSIVVWNEEKIALLRRREISGAALEALQGKGLLAALETGSLQLAQVAALAPDYRVHVYHDTGKKLKVDAVSYPILEAQTSFGMYPDHAGPFKGWLHRLEFPPGALQDEITPSFFRIHVPNNGKIKATVRVNAVERGGFKLPWWAWLLLLLLLLVLIMLFK